MSLSVNPENRSKQLANLAHGHGAMRWAGKLPIPPRAHPKVRRLFELMNETKTMIADVAQRSGLHGQAISKWRYNRNPTLPNFEAALNALGYELVIRRKEDA